MITAFTALSTCFFYICCFRLSMSPHLRNPWLRILHLYAPGPTTLHLHTRPSHKGQHPHQTPGTKIAINEKKVTHHITPVNTGAYVNRSTQAGQHPRPASPAQKGTITLCIQVTYKQRVKIGRIERDLIHCLFCLKFLNPHLRYLYYPD